MINKHPIVIVEDDADDCEMIQSALVAIGVENKQVCFSNGEAALKYLKDTKVETFLILSDINMPLLNGFELKKAINNDNILRSRSIPFIFLSTSKSKKEVVKAYDLLVQGFFIKPDSDDGIKQILQMITSYWNSCEQPNFN